MADKVDQNTRSVLIDALENIRNYTQELQERREKRLWKSVKLPCSLHATLNRLTKDELDKIRRNYQFKGLSALKKAELASELAQLIPVMFQNIIETLDQGRYDLIKDIVRHSGRVADRGLSVSKIETLMKQGILFPGIYENKKVLFMPDELIQRFEQSDGNALEKVVRRNTEWIQLAHGLLHYFGVMNAGRMMEKIETLTGQPIDFMNFMNVMVFACDFYGQAYLTAYGFRDNRVFDAAKIVDEYLMRPDLDDYPFTKKQLMKAADPDYIERSPQINRFIQFLLSHYEFSDREINEIMLHINYLIQTDENPSKVIQYLQTRIEVPSFDFVQQLLMEITEVYNHTRQWVLKGHMPAELVQEEKTYLKLLPEKPFVPVHAHAPAASEPATLKVGRNDPCPCGSGKKYKKCCGE